MDPDRPCVARKSSGGRKLATIDELMKNVYFTDCVKCESTESDFRYHQVHTADLNDEFKILERPVLLITIGSTAWDQARELDKFFVGKLSPVYGPYRDLRDDPPQDTEGLETWFGTHQGVADVHGMLFRDKGDKFVIPFTFVRGGALRDSRLKYLEEGLTALKAHPPVL